MKRIVAIGLSLKEAVRGWSEHRAQRLGAALAFFTTLALAPLTIIAIGLPAISSAKRRLAAESWTRSNIWWAGTGGRD